MTFLVAPLVVSVDVGATSIKGALAAEQTLFAHRRRAVRGLGADEVVGATLDMVDELVEEAGRHAEGAAAIGLAVPGLVDETAGVGTSSMLLGWSDVPFVELVRARHRLPVAFGHDVSAGAFAEARCGAAVGHRDWLFLALGTGLGSTFVLDGRPYRGSGGTGGELAHVVVDPNGPPCRCGKRGCLEMIASAGAIADRYRELGGTGDVGTEQIDAAGVAERAAAGDPVAAQVWQAAVDGLAVALAAYVEALGPSIVVVGGGLALAGDQLLGPLAAAVSSRVAFAEPRPAVVAARFGDEAALVGMASAAMVLSRQPERSHAAPFDLPTQSLVERP